MVIEQFLYRDCKSFYRNTTFRWLNLLDSKVWIYSRQFMKSFPWIWHLFLCWQSIKRKREREIETGREWEWSAWFRYGFQCHVSTFNSLSILLPLTVFTNSNWTATKETLIRNFRWITISWNARCDYLFISSLCECVCVCMLLSHRCRRLASHAFICRRSI